MENYKQKYEAALKQAKQELKACGSLDCDAARQIFRFFPELKKSEDERIKTNIIKFLRFVRDTHHQYFDECNEAIDWFEKQSGEIKSKSETVSTEQNEINDNILSRFAFYLYDDDTLYLSSVFVEECNRKHGYGTKILKAAEEVAKTFGIPKIRLKVETNSWMEEWYKRNGYVYLISEGKYDWLEKQSEQNKQNFWEKCNHCEYFDGYDLCLHKKNFGSVTNESKENCKNNNYMALK